MKFFPKIVIMAALALTGCKNVESPGGGNDGGGNNPPPQVSTLTGVWTGWEGASPTSLMPTARLELTEADGGVTGTWYSSAVFPDGGDWPVGAFNGTRDGGFVYMRDVATTLPDGGLTGGYVFTGTFTPPNHLEGVEVRTKHDGGPLPIYLKLDRAP